MFGETGDLPEMLRMMRCRRGFQYSAATVSFDLELKTSPITNHFCFPEQDIPSFLNPVANNRVKDPKILPTAGFFLYRINQIYNDKK